MQALENGHHLNEENRISVRYTLQKMYNIFESFHLAVVWVGLFWQEQVSSSPTKGFETPDSKLRRPPIDRQHVCIKRTGTFFFSSFYAIVEILVWVICHLYKVLLQEDVDALIDCVMKDVGFSQGKPVAAFTIYKCLLQWKSFEAERTSVFDRLIQMFGSAIEVLNFFLTFSLTVPWEL